MSMSSIKENLSLIHESIKSLCQESSRDPAAITLVAVSKFHPAELILEAYKAGHFTYGENYIAEATSKWSLLKTLLPPADYNKIELHLIGHIQKNKARAAVALTPFIDSVDSIPLLTLLQKIAASEKKSLSVLLELGTGEETKTGFPTLSALDEGARLLLSGAFPNIKLRGFMTMAPLGSTFSAAYEHFSTLRDYALSLSSPAPLSLSMGMSEDYPAALKAGSTEVRIGTAIFGPRKVAGTQ